MAERPPGRRGAPPEPLPELESLESAERTVLSEMPVFDDQEFDEEPTPVPAPRVEVRPEPRPSPPLPLGRPEAPRLRLPQPGEPSGAAADRPKLTLPVPGGARRSTPAAPEAEAGASPRLAEPALRGARPEIPAGSPAASVARPSAARQSAAGGPQLRRDRPRTGRYVLASTAILLTAVTGTLIWGTRGRGPRAVAVVTGERGTPAGDRAQELAMAPPPWPEAQGGARSEELRAREAREPPPPKTQSRHATPPRVWTPERLADLRAPDAKPRFGFEPSEKRAKRSYDNEVQESSVPMLMIFSQPPGMAVKVDGRLLGTTPLIRVLGKAPPRVEVELEGPGFRKKAETVRPSQDGNFELGVIMEPIEVAPPRPAP